MWFAYACVWISMAAVVIVAMFITNSWLPVWFMLMTIPFRCAPRHQRNMKPGTSNAASRNLLECT